MKCPGRGRGRGSAYDNDVICFPFLRPLLFRYDIPASEIGSSQIFFVCIHFLGVGIILDNQCFFFYVFNLYFPFLFFLIYSQLSFFDLILFNRQMLRIVENILSYIGLMLKLTFSETGKKKEYFEV